MTCRAATRHSSSSGTLEVAEHYVVDTTVFVRWWLPQVGFQHAREVRDDFLGGSVALQTTDLARVELAHVLRNKGLLTRVLSREEYLQAVQTLDAVEIPAVVAEPSRLVSAAALAADHSLRLFEALFVELALFTGWPLLTADVKLSRAVGSLISTEVLRGVARPS